MIRQTRSWLALVLASCALPSLAALPTPDPDDGGLTLPPGFRALIVADDLIDGRKVDNNTDRLRFLAAAPNGDLYAKTLRGGIIALRDTDGDGRFDLRREFGAGGGTGIAIQGDWLYHSTNSAVYRYPYRTDELVPSGEPQPIVVDLPDRRSHSSKSFAFDGEGRLLVEIGSPNNVYSEPDRQFGAKGKDATEHLKSFGGFWRFDANRPGQTQADGFRFATGQRHCLAIAWQPVAREFFMVMMGRDNMNTVAPEFYDALDNAERVAEEMHRLNEGANLGWPYTYWDPIKKARMIAPEFGGDNRKRAEPGLYAEPLLSFPAHWAPLQMTFHSGTQFPARYRGGAFVAFHGSWNRAPLPQDGYNICFVPFDERGAPLGTYEVFAANTGPQRYRMGGVAVAPDGSLFISETGRGRIWRIIYTGTTPAPAAAPTPAPATRAPAAAAPKPAPEAKVFVDTTHPGYRPYIRYCAVCHMADGTGAGQLNPSLVANAVVAGDPARLIKLILRGPAAALPADRAKFANVMPPFPMLKDQELADMLTYLRQTYGNTATPISPAEVTAVRQQR